MRQLKITIHLILAVILYLSILLGFRPPAMSEQAVLLCITDSSTTMKLAAFEILKTRCNACHLRKNPTKVFTSANMNSLAPKIYEQVFIRKRMPKGSTVRLTNHEYKTLQNWLITQNLEK